MTDAINDPKLPDVQPAPASPVPDQAPAADANGAATALPNPDLVARIERAADAAIDQHFDEQPVKRRPGQRGPDKRPRRPRVVPLAPMGDVSDPALLAEDIPAPLASSADLLSPVPTPFDRETAQEMAGFVTDFVNDLAGVGMEMWAIKHLGDEQLAADCATKARMGDQLRDRWEKSLVKLAEKHRVALDMAPEIIGAGCLLVWGTTLSKQAKAIKLQGQQLRQDTGQLQA